MSRGLGHVERAVLDALRADRDDDTVNEFGLSRLGRGVMTASELAAKLYGKEMSNAQLVSLRRALRSLVAKGLLTADHERRMIPIYRGPSQDTPAWFMTSTVYQLAAPADSLRTAD
jgi:hypothetical protein